MMKEYVFRDTKVNTYRGNELVWGRLVKIWIDKGIEYDSEEEMNFAIKCKEITQKPRLRKNARCNYCGYPHKLDTEYK